MKIGDKIKVRLTKKINGKPSGEYKYLSGEIKKINNKTVGIKLDRGGTYILRKKHEVSHETKEKSDGRKRENRNKTTRTD